jgi:hypothetical protein
VGETATRSRCPAGARAGSGARGSPDEVEEAARDERRRPVREDVAEAHGDERARAVDGELQGCLGEAENLERLGELLRVERERERVVLDLPYAAGELGAYRHQCPFR